MRMMPVAALSAMLLLSTAAGAVETKAPLEPSQNAEEKAGQAPKKICKRLATSGSRMEERVCLTKEQWKEVEKEVEG